MATVYVVTAGEYSDFHIEGVFSSPHLAKRGVQDLEEKAFNKVMACIAVEEWQLDDFSHIAKTQDQHPTL